MNIELQQVKNNSIGKNYNVEFEMGNGECMTFSGRLLTWKGTYLGFEVDGGIMWLNRNRLVWMMPIYERR